MKFNAILAVTTLLFSSIPLTSLADTQCGPFHLQTPASEGKVSSVNGVKVRKQKIDFLEQKEDYNNVSMRWMVAATKFQGDYVMHYMNKKGKGTLDVEIVRSSRSGIRISGSYDCEKKG